MDDLICPVSQKVRTFATEFAKSINKIGNMMNELLTTTTMRPMEVAFWLLLSLGIAIFLWLCWRNIQRSRRERINKVLALVLTIAALATGQTAWAESTWTVEVTSHNDNTNVTTFTITRSEKTYAQKVLYRTVGLTAYAGQNFTAVSGELEFLANEDTKTVTVTEKTPNANAYKYQCSTSRSYKLEVTDRAGYFLASATRNVTTGNNVSSSGLFEEKSFTIRSAEVTVTEDGYAQSSNPHTAASTSFYTAGTQAYLGFLNSELRMTLEFQAKEVNDGYQYVQILVDNTTGCDTGAGSGNPGTPSISRYMAGFDISGKGVDTYYKYSFPVTSVGNDAGATKPWTGIGNSAADLVKQKFNTNCRATDGKLILPTNFSTLVVRLNASGSDEDDWKATSVNPGRHAKGNTVYVSVAFSEIVNYTGTRELNTNWGTLSYVIGSGTNVLTFSGIIPQNTTENLSVSSISGTIKDLAGNSLSGGVSASNLCSVDGDLTYNLEDFQQEGGNYLIACHDDLWGLASYVNAGNTGGSKTFLQVTDVAFPHNDSWDNASSTENNFTAIGSSTYRFNGIYNGGGHTISGIRIYKGGTDNNTDSYQGLFGYVANGGTVRNVNLADARVTGNQSTGGIVGYIGNSTSTLENCTVGANVCIHAVVNNAESHGGVVGKCNGSSISGCISAVTITVANGLDVNEIQYNGGIVGYFQGTMSDCLAIGATVPAVKAGAYGAIAGRVSTNSSTPTRCYYLACTVAGEEKSDIYAITLPAHASLVRTASATLPGTGNATYTNGVDIAGVPYASASSAVTLSYDATALTPGYDVVITATQTSSGDPVTVTDNGDHTYSIASMPAADITVTATEVPFITYIDANGNEQRSLNPTAIVSSDDAQTLGTATATNWYYVSGNVNTKPLSFQDATTNIILCDNATLTISESSSTDAIHSSGLINIFAQSGGTGAINITECKNGIYVEKNVAFNGGVITVSAASNAGIYEKQGDVTIRRGRVDVSADVSANSYGIFANNQVTIKGGVVRAIGKRGIKTAYKCIQLGCSSASDRIYASSYEAQGQRGYVGVASGQTLTDGSATYSGKLTSEQLDAIAGKTLQSLRLSLPYIDADGNQKNAYNPTQIVESNFTQYLGTAEETNWYYVSGNVSTKQLQFKDATTNIILCDDATLTINVTSSYDAINYANEAMCSINIFAQSGGTGVINIPECKHGIYASNDVNINGGKITISSASSSGIWAGSGDLTIRRGRVDVSSTQQNIGARKNVNILGGVVSASGITATTGYIKLGYSTVEDRITASSYSTSYQPILVADGQALTDGTNYYSGTLTSAQTTALAGQTLSPLTAVSLADNASNATAIQTLNGAANLSVTLQGRTLYKDGDWNTLCLPFDVTDGDTNDGLTFSGTPLEGATVMELNSSTSNLDGKGQLTLNFTNAASIEAGKPYIVRWGTRDSNPGGTILNPVFTGVNIINSGPAPVKFSFVGNSADCQFVGNYAPLEITEATNRNNIVVLTSGSRLGYTTSDRTIAKGNALGAFRAYFYIPANGGSTSASSFELNFEDEETTSLSEELRVKSEEFLSGESVARNATATDWYTLDGRKLQGKPTQKGIYIYKGKKVKR